MTFFGEGAAGIGTVHECMNMAAIWKLPVLFVCENNGYAQATPFDMPARSRTSPTVLARTACRARWSTARMRSRCGVPRTVR